MFKKTFSVVLLMAVMAEARRSRSSGREGRGGRGDDGDEDATEWGARGGRDGRDEPGSRDSEPLPDGTARTGQRKEKKRETESQVAEDDLEAVKMFVSWVQTHGRNYHTTDEFESRAKVWKENNRVIRENNKAADQSDNPHAPRMAHNDNSDMDRDEVGFKLGLRQMEDRRMLQAFDEEPRRLSTLGTAVNHTAYTLPVDDQGYCGSCWAVAGNTVLEATIALRDTTAGGVVTKLSDQMPVDCSHESELNEMIMGFDLYDYWQFGCWGGHQERLWDFYQVAGVQTEVDYPYVSGANGGYETMCKYDQYTATYPVTGRGEVSTAEDIRAKLEERPLTVSIAADDQNFSFYSSGIVDSQSPFCGSTTNHAMSLVGYEPGDGTVEEVTVTETFCRRRRWYDRYYRTGCRWFDEFYYQGYCCWEETSTETTTNDTAYWLVQNQYGSGWGESGFIKYAVESGAGACNINTDVDYVTVANEAV